MLLLLQVIALSIQQHHAINLCCTQVEYIVMSIARVSAYQVVNYHESPVLVKPVLLYKVACCVRYYRNAFEIGVPSLTDSFNLLKKKALNG